MDYDELVPDEIIQKLIPPNNTRGEKYQMSCNAYKISRREVKQERILLLSNQAIYLLTDKECRK